MVTGKVFIACKHFVYRQQTYRLQAINKVFQPRLESWNSFAMIGNEGK